jgi:adenosylcobinamide kinase / adenosylcobinamide-phosphate guanylyltransferase
LGKKILITGGIKSGKSRFALDLAREIEEAVPQLPSLSISTSDPAVPQPPSLTISTPNPKEKIFIATARPVDREMQDKIERHKKERGSDFKTVEEAIHLATVLKKMNPSTAIIECLTLWLSNLFFEVGESEKLQEIESLIAALKEFKGNLIIVTNEVGWGIIPQDEISRRFQAELGSLNQKVAQICDEVYALISRIPLKIK